MPEFSVVIPLYNKEKHITRAINSVLAQTVQDFEIVVVDDGSKDRGADIVESIHDPRIRLVRQVNAGSSAARNKGIEETRAELIAFLDADDAWRPDFLETIRRLRKNYPQAGIYAASFEIQEEGVKAYIPNYKAVPPAPWEGILPNYFESLLGSAPVWTSACVVPKKIFGELGTFTLGARRSQDSDMWLRIASKYPVYFSHGTAKATYYKDSQNRACVMVAPIADSALIKTIERLIASADISVKDKSYLQEYLSKKKIEVAKHCLRTGEVRIVREVLKGCPTRLFQRQKRVYQILSFFPHSFVSFLFDFQKHSRQNQE